MADSWQQRVPFAGSQWTPDNQPCPTSSTLRDFLSAFPKPRLSGRVSKPRSAENSPSFAGRRRTTTMPHSSAMYRPLPNQDYQDYQASIHAALLASSLQRERQSRPMSWHPTSVQPDYSNPSHYYPLNTTMSSHNMPVTQPSQAMAGTFDDANVLQSYGPSQQHFPFPMAENYLPMQEPSYLQANNPQFDGASWDGSSTSGFPSYAPVSNDWAFDMVSMHHSIPSAGVAGSNYGSVSSPGRLTEPTTPDFLPIQQFGDDTEPQSMSTLEKPHPEDELVGMGLYNNPDSFAEGTLYGLNGKGLKLEETFSPSSDNEADENDAEDDDQQQANETQNYNSASQIQKQSDSHYAQSNKPTESILQKSFFFEDDDDSQQHEFTEARPSNNFGATSCMNMSYGYGWI